MSIESKEIKDIYALYQNLYEKNTRLDKSKYDLNKLQGGLSRDEYNNLSNSERNQLNRALKVQSLQNTGKEVGLKKGEGPVTVSSVNDEGKPKRVDNQSNNTSSDKKEYGGEGTKTVLNKDGSKTTTTGHSDDIGKGSFGGTKASSEKGKKILNPEKEKVTPSKVITKGGPDRSGTQSSQKDEVITKPASKVITKGGPDRSGTQSSTSSKVITKGGPDRSGTQSSTAEKSKPQLGGHAKLNAQKIEKSRVEKIKANQPAPTEKDLEDAKKEADTANIAKLSGKYKEVPAPGPGNDGKTVLQKVKNPNPKDNKLDPTPIKKPVDTPVKTPVAKPKITARSLMRQRNIDRFGADKVNALQQKQKDFKSMQAKSMMPGAKPGAAKAEFAKKHPTSNVAKDLKKSKRVTSVMDMMDSYDPSLNEDGSIGKVVGGLAKPTKPKSKYNRDNRVLTKSVAKPKYDGEVLTRSVIMTKDQAKKLNSKTEDYDAYDLVLNYLLETNQVDTIEEANYVMIQMDEATIQGIVNEYA